MNILKISAVLGLLLLGLVLTTVVYGQEPVNQSGGDVGDQGGIGTESLTDDPPSGKKVFYMFTGVQRDLTTTPTISTRVYCSNYGSGAVEIKVQFFPDNGGYGPTITKSLSSGYTDVFDLAGSDYDGFFTLVGSGRVIANDSSDTKIICTAQVYHTVNPPGFAARLHLFDSSGNLIGGDSGYDQGGIFMPIILKNS